MPSPETRRDIELSEDMEFQRKNWRVERVGWAILGLIVLAAALGLFGHGLLGRAVVAADDDSVSLDYDRFWRLSSPTRLEFEIRPAQSDGRVELWIDRSYLRAVNVTGFTPEPESVRAGPDRLHFVFELAEAEAPLGITLEVEPNQPWALRGRAGVAGAGEVAFSQFVHP
jgi:hypothetical protein